MQPIRREGLLVSEILPLCQPEQLRLGPAGAATLVPSGLLHLQRGGPTGPGADPKPVLAGVVRQSSLASGLPAMMLVKVQQLFRKTGLVKLGHVSQGRTKVSEQSESQSQLA